MGSGVTRMPSEAEFIYFGLVKEGWKHLSIPTIQLYLDCPERLEEDGLFLDDFFKYHEWYWRDNAR